MKVQLQLLALVLAGSVVTAQNPPAPRFEVASIRPSPPVSIGELTSTAPGTFEPDRFVARNATLLIVIHRAYPEFSRRERLIAPDWIRRERFDVDGRAGRNASVAELRLMLRHLLVDRFKMQSHTEKRLVDTFDLVIARRDGRLGPQIQRSTNVCDEWNATVAQEGRELPQPELVRIPCGWRDGIVKGVRQVTSGGLSMFALVTMLRGVVGTTVTDRTGLTGNFDMELSWAADDTLSVDSPQTAPTLRNALEDQLGFRLHPAKELAEVLVITHIERPTPN